MSTNQVLALLAIVVPSTTAFLVAHWHRKQARQLEAARRDPSVGLDPPPSALWIHLTQHWQLWMYCAAIGLGAVNLNSVLRGTEPIARSTIVAISLTISGILVNLVLVSLHFVSASQQVTVGMIAKLTKTDTAIIELIRVNKELAAAELERAKVGGSAGGAE